MTGRPPYTPTDEQRRTVRALAGFGVPHDDIALVVTCSPPTLRKWFRHELDVATIEANARVAQILFQQATTPGNIAATIFWLKARAGWRERPLPDGAADAAASQPLVIIRRIVDPATNSTTDLVFRHPPLEAPPHDDP